MHPLTLFLQSAGTIEIHCCEHRRGIDLVTQCGVALRVRAKLELHEARALIAALEQQIDTAERTPADAH